MTTSIRQLREDVGEEEEASDVVAAVAAVVDQEAEAEARRATTMGSMVSVDFALSSCPMSGRGSGRPV